MEFKCLRVSRKVKSWRHHYSHQAQKPNRANTIRISTLIHVPHYTVQRLIVVKELIGEEKARKVEELAIQLYSKVSSLHLLGH